PAEAQVGFFGFRQKPLLATLHSPGQRAAGANRIHAIEITETRGLQYGFRLLDTAKGSEREQSLVFQPLLLSVHRFEQTLTADRARSAAVASSETGFRKSFAAQGLGVVEGRLLEIMRGQDAQTIEDRQIGDGPDTSIFVRE